MTAPVRGTQSNGASILASSIMRFDILTIFPGFFSGFFEHGMVRRALAEGIAYAHVHDLRAFTHDRHRTVDDRPFGGGEGMVLKPEPIAQALASLGIAAKPEPPAASTSPAGSADPRQGTTSQAGKGLPPIEFCNQGTASAVPKTPEEKSGASAPEASASPRVILLSAQGRPFTQPMARELASLDRIVLVCGRYEGVDERINTLFCDHELSIGDYVLSGGELAAAVVVDAVTRLLPGVLGNEASRDFESFGAADAEISADQQGVPRSQHGSGGLLDYPHYTRPAEFSGLRVPDVLVNGDHAQIRRWRREQQLRKTLLNRPDLLDRALLTPEDRKLIASIRHES
jgi:tRNA (guanine37-N1)-methyltransferase